MQYKLSKDENAKRYDTLDEACKAAIAIWKYRFGIHEVGGSPISVYDDGDHEIGQVGYKTNISDEILKDGDDKTYFGYTYSDKTGLFKLSESGEVGDALDTTDTSNLRVRKLTPRECMRLMGYNDAEIDRLMEAKTVKTTKAGKVSEKPTYSNSAIYRFAGNSVVVDCFAAILGEIVKDMDGQSRKQTNLDAYP